MFKKIREINQIRKQGFRNSDCYSIDYFMMTIFPKMIRKLRERKIGSPMNVSFDDIKDYPIEFIEYAMKVIEDEFYNNGYFNKKDNDAFETIDLFDGFTQWSIILLRIAYCFEMTNEDNYENEYSDDYFDQAFDGHWFKYEDIGNGFSKIVFNKVDEDLDKKYHEREKEIEDTIIQMKDEAFSLLSKWYFNLWD